MWKKGSHRKVGLSQLCYRKIVQLCTLSAHKISFKLKRSSFVPFLADTCIHLPTSLLWGYGRDILFTMMDQMCNVYALFKFYLKVPVCLLRS